jgi:hypothetical protein
MSYKGRIAQWLECESYKFGVTGSSPVASTFYKNIKQNFLTMTIATHDDVQSFSIPGSGHPVDFERCRIALQARIATFNVAHYGLLRQPIHNCNG